MHRSAVRRAVVAFLLLAPPPLLLAAAGSAVLRGTLRTREGQPLPGVLVTVTGPQSRTLLTGPDGRYEASGLPAGEYRLAVAEPGFVLAPEPVANLGAEPVSLDLVLAPAPVREQVLVAATRGEATSVHTRCERERARPRDDREPRELVLPSPRAGPARGGGRAHGRTRQPGLDVRARRRVAFRPDPGGRRARQHAGRRSTTSAAPCPSTTSGSRWCGAR